MPRKALILAVAIAALALPATSSAYIYWTNNDPVWKDNFADRIDSIGRANLDGSSPNQNFITPYAQNDQGIAVDASHIYWVDAFAGVHRADLAGNIDGGFFAPGLWGTGDVAVDSSDVFYTLHYQGWIARSDLNGTNVNDTLVTGTGNAAGLATDGQHVYWSNAAPGEFSGTTIGRSNLDGSDPHNDFITGASDPGGLAVDGHYIYWANYDTGMIGRANLDGTGVNQDFVDTSAPGQLTGVAVDGQHIYWAQRGTGIGRANSDGTLVQSNFIAAPNVFDVAADHTYTINGFFSPVNNLPTLNTGKAGKTYPLKWQLRDSAGNLVTSLSAVSSIKYQGVSCGDLSTTTTDALEIAVSGGTSLRYDSTANQFVDNWSTPAKGCYTVTVTFDTQQQLSANFKLS